MKKTDVFIGLSVGNVVSQKMLKTMNKNPIVFAMANPDPEISYSNAKKARKDLIRWTKKRTSLPLVAIGGIDNKNFKSLLKFGVNYLAISSFIWNNPRLKPKEAIKLFRQYRKQLKNE